MQLGPAGIDDRLAGRKNDSIVKRLGSIAGENVQLRRRGEHHLQVLYGQDLLLTRFEPLHPCLTLTLRATTVTARTVQPVLSPASFTCTRHRSHCFRSAARDVTNGLTLIRRSEPGLEVLLGLPSHD